MNPVKRLLLAIALSLSAHITLLAWQTQVAAPGASTKLVVRLSPNQLMGAKATHTHLEADQALPEQSPPTSQPALPEEHEPLSPLIPVRGVALGSEALDSPLMLAEGLSLEPEGGYPAELSGQITLDLLVDEQGHPIWIGTVSSDVDTETMQFIIEKFAQAKFSKPTVKGHASKVLIRVEIQVGAAMPN